MHVLLWKTAGGNCSSEELVALLPKWTTFMGSPSRCHVDYEGCFEGEPFMKYCSDSTNQRSMCAGEAHRQNGIVERHIGTCKTLLDKLILESEATTDATSASVEVLDNLIS